MKTMHRLCFAIAATWLISTTHAQTPAKNVDAIWNELYSVVQSHVYPARGQMQRQPLPDFDKQLAALDKVLPKAAGTTVEPLALYYKGNTLFHLNRFAAGKAVFEDIKRRFPSHGICRGTKKQVSLIDDALSDCASEIAVRKSYVVTELPHATLNPKVRCIMHTSQGDLEFQFYTAVAPKAVANFKKLAKEGYYNGSYFHRVESFRRIDGGCPNTKPGNRDRQDDGLGSAGYTVPLEFSDALQSAGALSMHSVSSGKSAHGSQFTICVSAQPNLNNKQAVFGRLVKGLQFLRRMSQTRADDRQNPYEKIELRSVEWIEED